MHITQCLLESGAELDLVNKKLIFQLWKHCNQRGLLPDLQTATKQPLCVEDEMLLSVRFRSLCVRVWLGVVPDLAVDMLLSTSSFDNFHLWHVPIRAQSHSMAFSPCGHSVLLSTNHNQRLKSSLEAALICESQRDDYVEESPNPICIE